METQQLNNYKIEFYSEEEWNTLCGFEDCTLGEFKESASKWSSNYFHVGLVSDIREELAEKIVDKDLCTSCNFNDSLFIDYNTNNPIIFNAKQSFQTLSKLPYCVITKL